VSIPFRNAAQIEAGGNAAFIRIIAGSTPQERVGAILQVNALGEPIEFVFNRMQVPSGGLWRGGDLRRYVNRTLLISLFQAAQRAPLVLCCLAKEIDAQTFAEDVQVQIAVCRVGRMGDVTGLAESETEEEMSSSDAPIHMFWVGQAPGPESPHRKLVDTLARRGLLLEPFDRILSGLREALGSDAVKGSGHADSISSQRG
jgi:hypothetical protein